MIAVLRNRGIAFKLVFLILISEVAIFVLIFGYDYLVSRQIIVKNIRSNAQNLAKATVNRIDAVLGSVEKIPQNLAYFVEDASIMDGGLIDLLGTVVEKNRDIYGSTIAFEPYAYSKNSLCFAPYFYKKDGKLNFTYLDCKSYRYFLWDWYKAPKNLNHPVWSEPYYDKGGGNIIMSTYSVPFYKKVSGKRRFMGVVTADISLSRLQDIVDSIKIARTGYGFLISGNGTFVTHPDKNLIMNETIFGVAETKGDPILREVGREMIGDKSGFVPFKSVITNKICWIAYAPLDCNNWSLGVLFPEDELMADISRLKHVVWFLSIAGLLLLLLVIVFIAQSLTRPLRGLAEATEHIASGNLDVELPRIKSRDEVGALADSFDFMKASLKQYIKDLTAATAAKERIESELHVARQIQMGMLHKSFPPFPKLSQFDIYAILEPAREVGGDLYDFFFVDGTHLCFSIGDVSGKGVPAALFMAVTQTLIKTKGSFGFSPGEILTKVNEDLLMDNPSVMFVTLFLGILDIETGELEYSSGGHNPPFIVRQDGEAKAMELTDGTILGVVGDISFKSKTIVLRRGDTIFAYTDGVTEAMNETKELFGESRLKDNLIALKDKPIDQVAAGVMEKIRAFSGRTAQSDDITMLLLRYYSAVEAVGHVK